ncbi:DNA-binding IclR family transcriptional regulator [Kribbella amoyensis]|uniref:DNA-binding IclR family transcriptional regulator n=1 Tax=Kribbella amoyensis TaxID=996641 RepID=A0A561BUM4_9ACTN|nr:helix-turn-helix domain-containing protein [Kribbella amoyensis]TWD82569.1 DNA-binding IclR family transcriptional regulator [Kribbella amoyensis]
MTDFRSDAAPAPIAAGSERNPPGSGSNQALARGLHILRMLVDEGEPMTATEIARRIGMHQSSASRILATLGEVGYVRKDQGRFAPDYGVLALGSATTRLPLIQRPRAAFEQLTAEHGDITMTMCMLWRDELLYLLRQTSGSEPLAFWTGAFPINVSAPGLRLLVDLPDEEALHILRMARQRNGWGGRPEIVPSTEEGLLAKARATVADDVLIMADWVVEGRTSGAIPLITPEPHPVALAIVDDVGALGPDRLALLLHKARRLVEQSFLT